MSSDEQDGGTVDAAVVLDPDEYTQRRRLEELFDLRQNVQDTRQDAEMLVAQRGDFDRDDANRVYTTALQSYLMEIEPLATKQYPDTGERYWYDIDIGTAEYHLPRKESPGAGRGSTPSETQEEQFTGLKSVADTEPTRTIAYESQAGDRHTINSTERHTATFTIPKWILDNTYRTANLFLADIGMDLDPDAADTGNWEI
jgi:hypothetical protein